MSDTAMRLSGPFTAYCEHCEMNFQSQQGLKAAVRHPVHDEWPDMNPRLAELYLKCPNAGKIFKFPAMEEA
jgi:hypothetical protein